MFLSFLVNCFVSFYIKINPSSSKYISVNIYVSVLWLAGTAVAVNRVGNGGSVVV